MKVLAKALLVISVLSLIGCGEDSKNKNKDSSPLGADLSQEKLLLNGECLSVEKIRANLNGLNSGAPVTVVTTDLSISSRKSIRSNFEKIMAFNNLTANQKVMGDLRESSGFTQNDCSTVTENFEDGSQKEYKVKDASSEFIRIESKEGDGLAYKILSPRSLLVSRTYVAYDVPCRSEKTPVYVTVAKVYDWSGGGLPSVIEQQTSPFWINKSLLSKAAQAVGYPEASLFVMSPETQSESLDVLKLQEMMAMSPLPEVVSCNGDFYEPSEPEPDEGEESEQPGSSEAAEPSEPVSDPATAAPPETATEPANPDATP